MNDARRFSDATFRNREPISNVLTRFVNADSRILEIASGSGEHAIFLADTLGVHSWQPSDPSREARASIDAWREHSPSPRVLKAIELDVEKAWPAGPWDVIVCINMIHIAPWSACEALMRGASATLGDGGVLFLYGPYKRKGSHTAPSNEIFDQNLRARNPEWGVRDLENVVEVARSNRLILEETFAMPANNFSVVFKAKKGLSIRPPRAS